MTTTAPARPATGPLIASGHSAARRTLLTLLACALGVTPLKAMLSDNAWLLQSWLAMAVVLVPAALLRLRRTPSALDIWPGIILLVPWLTALYVPHHAWGGFIPSGHTFGDVGDLMDSLHKTTTDEVAPIHSTIAVRLVICALLGLLAALIDLIAVVGRRGALGGVPLLVVYTVSGAVPRTPVAWFWFGLAAVGFLILLALDAGDELRHWGRRISRTDAATNRPVLGVSAQRIGVLAIIAAIVLPFLVPDHPKNVIADLFHDSNGSGLGGFGAGSGGGGQISPFAALKGQLNRDKPTPLMTVHVDDSDGPVQPFYARTNVLDKFTGKGWTVSGHGDTAPIGGAFATEPATDAPQTTTYQVSVQVTGLTGNAPVFTVPLRVQGLDGDARWSSQDQVLLGGNLHRGDEFSELVAQPEPTVRDLQATPPANAAEMHRWLQLPDLPAFVDNLVKQITSGRANPYQKARAISDWFADPANGFSYSLKTAKGDSGNDLVDFLQQRTGFCQQYAAAMGVMLRLAGVPARVVLGYMHAAPNKAGNFSVTTFDAHAWVEAYFPGAGWIPFDPTPTAGLTGGRKTDLPWAPHVFSSNDSGVPTRGNAVPSQNRSSSSAAASQSAAAAPSSRGSSPTSAMWAGLAVLALIVLGMVPAGVRAGRRRRRYAVARRGDPDALWAELSDTATDLGYVWSPARSPRQVSDWLAPDAADSAPALTALAAAVEQRRYSPDTRPRDTSALARGLREVTDRLRARRSGRARLLARFWPASLGWGRWLGGAARWARRRH